MTSRIVAAAPPNWLRRSVIDSIAHCGDHIRAVEVEDHPDRAVPVHTIAVAFVSTNLRGRHLETTARIHVPDAVQQSTRPLPLLFEAGYALDEATALSWAGAGRIVVTHGPDTDRVAGHPASRGINADAALLHIARRLPIVDDARVVIHGVSAGGRAALLLAAETFPLAAVVAERPPVNWPYNAAYLAKNSAFTAGGLAEAAAVIDQCAEVIGSHDVETAPWIELSPHTHIDLIPGPVALTFTTADALVPVDQVGEGWAQAAPPEIFGRGFTTDPALLLDLPENRERLLDILPCDAVEIRRVPLRVSADPGAASTDRTPLVIAPSDKPWTVTVVDEGFPEPRWLSFERVLQVDSKPFVDAQLGRPPHPGDLTLYKLMVMMRRYRGLPWLVHGYPHLDSAAAERADVVRALRTYVDIGGADHLRSLYSALPADVQVFGSAVGEGSIDVVDAVVSARATGITDPAPAPSSLAATS